MGGYPPECDKERDKTRKSRFHLALLNVREGGQGAIDDFYRDLLQSNTREDEGPGHQEHKPSEDVSTESCVVVPRQPDLPARVDD
jgi:hypothetical protein